MKPDQILTLPNTTRLDVALVMDVLVEHDRRRLVGGA